MLSKFSILGLYLKKIPKIGAKAISLLLTFLIYGIRPLLGPSNCKYPTSCTLYAAEQLETQPLFSAIWAIIKRVCSCNPFMDPRL